MKQIALSEIKDDFSRLLREAASERIVITRHGRPVAEVIPAGPDRTRKFIGDMVRTAKIVGDIVSPVIGLEDIEAYRD